MKYLLAILLPPVAVLMCGKPVQACLNVLLTICFWIPGVIHAMLVVSSTQADNRTTKLVTSNAAVAAAIERQTAAQLTAQQAQLQRDAIR